MGGILYFLTGTTAAGKSDWALRWAESRAGGAEILSCDSLLFYRGMDIGTAKPTPAERARIIHHGIDLSPPDRPVSIREYVDYARNTIESARSRGRVLLVTGGSGFYLKSFFSNVLDPVEVPPELSRSIREDFRNHGLEKILARLRQLNPEGLGNLDLQNPRRVIRALERSIASGRPLHALQDEFQRLPKPFPDLRKSVCLLTRNRDSLARRIQSRTRKMIENGLIDEVRRLRETGFELNASAAGAIGYRETLAYLRGDLPDQNALVESIVRNTQQLARKQRSWFRHQIPVSREINLDEAPSNFQPDDLFPE